MRPLGFTAFVLAVVFILLALFASRTYPAQCQNEWEKRNVPGYMICGSDYYGLPVLYPDTLKFFKARTALEGDSVKTFFRCVKCGNRLVVLSHKTQYAIWRDSVNAVIDSVRKGIK